MSIINYLEPDSRWSLWHCKTNEEFIEKFLVKGKFHKDVPEDVIKEYTTVEHLVAHSFYYYPMFDEAFSKTTRIFEMAVKLRCDQLGVKPSGKGFIPLNNYISALKEYYGDISEDWENEKKLRNLFAHPEKHFFMGPINRFYAFQHFVNIINKLFSSREKLDEVKNNTIELANKFKNFKKGIFILDSEDKLFVIERVVPHICIYKNEKSYSFWEFRPILTKFPQTMDEYSTINPLYRIIENLEFKDNTISGLDAKSNNHIKIYKSNSPIDNKVALNYKSMYTSSDERVKHVYEGHINNFIAQQLSLFEYEFCWD
ncbi:MAG: hypothetical protein F9K37_01510 [Bacteroidales bacterium]|nr:MAG: hypothetical protein F9K37_01510 [Bacteroidales bacterium]